MKHVRLVEIQCGDRTCASAPGKFCQFVRVSHFGSQWQCHLYETRLYAEPDDDGWLQRTKQCRVDFEAQ